MAVNCCTSHARARALPGVAVRRPSMLSAESVAKRDMSTRVAESRGAANGWAPMGAAATRSTVSRQEQEQERMTDELKGR